MVTNFSFLFNQCYSLKNINLQGVYTNKAVDMKFMFYSCGNLLTIDISKFITEKCENFVNIFGKCNKELTVYLNPINNIGLINSIENYINIIYIYDL